MTRRALFLVLPLTLAGCGVDPAPRHDKGLPRAIIGHWATTPAACAGGPGNFIAQPGIVRFGNTLGVVTVVTPMDDGVVAVDATLSGGTTHSYDFHPSADGRTLRQVEGEVPDILYRRCP